MPLITPIGDVIAGGGGSQGSLNGVPYPFASSGRGCVPDPVNLTLLVQLKPQNVLATWQPSTGAVNILQPPRGANAMAGGGGRWLADGAGFVYGSLGDIPGAALIGAAWDGTLAYYPNAQSGIGLVIVDPDGTRHDYPSVIAKPAPQVIKAGQVIWQGGAVGRPPLRPALANAAGPQLVTASGEDWIVYWSQGVGLVAQVDGEASGWVLDTRELEFNASIAAVDGVLRIAWSVTAGEGPKDIAVCAVTRAAVTYLTLADGWTPQTARWGELVAPQPPVVIPTFTFTHPVIVAPFKAEGSGLPDLFTFGTYREGDLPVPMPTGRLLLGHDALSDWTPPAGLRPYDVPMLEGYRFPEETLAQSVARWIRQMRQVLGVWPGDVGWIPMFYDQLRWTIGQILDGLESLDAVVNLSPRVKLIAPFAYNRANGIIKYPELQAALGNLVTAQQAAGTAVLLPIPPDPPDPPIPPKPVPFPRAKVFMTPTRVALRLGQFFASVDHAVHPFPGWMGLKFTDKTPVEVFTIATPQAGNPKLLIRPEAMPTAALSADATEFSGDLASEFGVKPDVSDADWGGYEAWNGWTLDNGIKIVLVEYDRDGARYTSACLTVVEL